LLSSLPARHLTPAAGLVALPSAEVPLQIFEARYRVLFNTLLAGESG